MTQEQDLLVRWRSLPAEQQQTVLDFIQFLHTKRPSAPVASAAVQLSLGDSGTDRFANRLRNLRSQIVASGEPLLSQAALEQELASRRGGVEPD
ncbi:hypothetical protein [Nodosilinea sp. P-1105]|uniref:hypothetical protein n=1 Tax=Nodosilinea sp. P-1105 TaxID=2546229 RepID=UPI00146AEB8F|nr:hypothetical protein [Nodosilinea sp. P-1105]NMF86258.1 hypothetical protein [Nodosilinea sp. P-1105]